MSRFLTVRQIVLVIVGFTIGAGILALPKTATEMLGPGGWLVVLGVGLLFIIGGLITARLARRFPEDTIIEFSQKLLGKPMGWIIGLLFILFFFSFIPIEIRVLQELVNISLLPQAPTWFVSGSFIFVLAYGASRDLKSIIYVTELLIEIALVIGFLVTFFAWQHFDSIHLLPILGEKQINLERLREIFGISFIYAGFPVVFFLFPFLKLPNKIGKATVIATSIIAFTYTFFTLTVIGVFGYKEVLGLAFPGLELAKSVNLETVILERLDLVLIVSWISAIFTTCLVAYFITAFAISKILRIKSHSLITWALVPITYYLSTLFTNYFVWKEWSSYAGVFAAVISLLLPALLLVIARVRHGRKIM